MILYGRSFCLDDTDNLFELLLSRLGAVLLQLFQLLSVKVSLLIFGLRSRTLQQSTEGFGVVE